jgi:predicted permease
MAKNMGHEGVLSSSVVMLTTLFSAFTLTGWLYLLKSLSLI